MKHKQYTRLATVFESSMRGIAHKLAGRDATLVEDLVQVGHLALLSLDLRKAKRNTDAYIRQSMKFRMIDHLRKMRPRDYWPLDAFLEDGHDLVYDDDTGEVCMTRVTGDRRHGGIYWAIDPQLQP